MCGDVTICNQVQQKQRGFTLMEIMVVMLLVGITMAIASIRITRDFDRVALKEAERFIGLLEHIREESVLTGRLHGIEVDDSTKTYRFMVEANGWQEVTGNQILRPRTIPDPLEVRSDMNYKPRKKGAKPLVLNKQLKKKQAKNKNVMLVTPVGDITSFELIIVGDTLNYRIALNDSHEPSIVEQDPNKI